MSAPRVGTTESHFTVLITLLVCSVHLTNSLDFHPFPKLEYYTRPEYGVIFRPLKQLFIPTDSVTHVFFQLKFPKIPEFPAIPDINTERCTDKSDHELHKVLYPSERETRRHLEYSVYEIDPLSEYNAAFGRVSPTRSTPASRRKFHDDKHQELLKQRKETENERRVACQAMTRQLNQTLARYKALRDDIRQDYNGLSELLRQNAYTDSSRTRTIRAIFSFLQPAFQSLFGLATETQIEQVQENLNRIKTNQETMYNDSEHIYHQVAHIANITSRRIDVLWEGLEIQKQNINHTADVLRSLALNLTGGLINLGRSMQHLHQWSVLKQSVHEQATSLNLDAMMVKSKLSVWMRSLTQLMRQYLPSELVTPYELSRALAQSRRALGDRRSQFGLVHGEDDLHYYYTQPLTKLFITHDPITNTFILRIYLKVPIAVSEVQLNAFQVIKIQVPIHTNSSMPGQGYTILGPTNDYFIISKSQNSYAELTTRDYDYCLSLGDNICPALSLNRDKHDPSCLAALYLNDHETIQRKCTFEYYPKGITPTYAVFVREGIYIVAARTAQIKFVCAAHSTRTTYAYFAQIQIPCNCAVTSEFLYIPASFANCELTAAEVLISYPFNLVQVAMEPGFDATTLLEAQHTFGFKQPSLETPEFFQLAELSQLRHEDEALQLVLDTRQIGRARERVTLQDLQAIKYESSSSYDLINTILHYCLEGMALACCFLIALKLYKINTILLTLLHGAKAFVITPSPHLLTPDNHDSGGTIHVSDAVVLFLTSALVSILLQLLKYAAKRFLKQKLKPLNVTETTVYLVFTNVHNSHVELLFTVNECVQHIQITNMPDLSDNYYTRTWFHKPTVTLSWAQPIVIKVLGMVQEISLPNKLRLPMPLAKSLFASGRAARTDRDRSRVAIAVKLQCTCGCKITKTGLSTILNPLQIHPTPPTAAPETGQQMVQPTVDPMIEPTFTKAAPKIRRV